MQKKISYREIQVQLGKFSNRWKDYKLNEKTGAQTFQNEFFEAFGIVFDPNKLPYEFNTGEGFADCYIKGKVILEMKDGNKVKTKEDLIKCIPQAMRYWKARGKEVNYLVLSNFKGFIVVDTRDLSKAYIRLSELEAKLSSFAFLFDSSSYLLKEQEAVSRSATKIMGRLYKSLRARLAENKEEEIDIFILQCVFCMFAEDVGFLPNGIFSNLVDKAKEKQFNSAHLLANLFKSMDEQDNSKKQGSLFENVRWFNGPLFKVKPEIVLSDEELDDLSEACLFDWSQIKPEIFGVLFESSTEDTERHENGMHFTSEEDILKIIKPCVVDYWHEKYDACNTQADFEKLHKELKSYRVLDPACGSGNFLLVAYRELKRFEAQIFHKISTLTGKSYQWVQNHMGFYPVQNLYGIEVKLFPTHIAKVSLWIAKKTMQMELRLDEPDLPLESLTHIICTDALQTKWDEVDVVIGNPPFIGPKQIRGFRGDEYFKWLGKRFTNHNKMSDYCTYWYEKCFSDLRAGVRVGLVSTKTVTQTNSREASLDKILSTGGEIFNAISSQKWSGEAQVTVSIINFINKKPYTGITPRMLDGNVVKRISSRLRSGNDDSTSTTQEASPIPYNKNIAFVGVMPNGKGFLLSEENAKKLIKNDSTTKQALKKYLTGEDINQNPDQTPSRWIIDFQDWPLEKASQFKEIFSHVKKLVKPERDKVSRVRHKERWWRYGEERMGMRNKTAPLKQFIAVSRVSKYPIFVMFENNNIIAGDSTVVFASDSYEMMGILQSKMHTEWYKYQCSTFETRLRYTNSTVFETFPFPINGNEEIAKVMLEIERYRATACKEQKIGLTSLYNQLNDGGHDLLKKLHEKLDKAVAGSYGFPSSKLTDSKAIIDFLCKLNKVYTSKKDHKELSERISALIEKAGKKSASRKKKA